MTASRDWTVTEIRRAVAEGTTSAETICEAYLARIERDEPKVGAFTAVWADRARERARAVDADHERRADQPLLGVPVTIKDVICTRDTETTGASRILRGYRPPFDATVVRRLLDAGAVIVGKTNCDEFAMGSSTEHSAHGVTRNPWDLERIPGGSSGGAAAAVAARLAPVSIASDTGGSIRQPASFCGVVGLKPTYGRVSRYGLLAFASSLDQIGPMALTVADTEAVFAAITGPDPSDATTVAPPNDGREAVDVSALRVGVPRRILDDVGGLDDEVRTAFEASLATLSDAGVTLVDVELPHLPYAIPAYYLIAPAEASSNLARYDGVRYGFRATLDGDQDGLAAMYDRTRDEGFGPEVKRRIMLGTYALSAGYYDAYYAKAQQVRTLIRGDYEQAFGDADAIALPTTPAPAFKLGERVDDPLAMYLGDVFTVSANLTGLPALSLPVALSGSTLPIGFQLMGRAFEEGTLFQMGEVLERRGPWIRSRPEV